MLRKFFGAAIALVLYGLTPAAAQVNISAHTVASCGAEAFPADAYFPVEMDTTGRPCPPAVGGAVTGNVGILDSGAVRIDPATSPRQDTTNTDLGPPGATACATDTGSCSLNALMQRLAQRITSAIAGTAVSQSGTWLDGVKGADGSTIASTSNPVPIVSAVSTSGGASTFSQNITTAGSGAGTGGVAVDASPGQLYGYALWNGNSSVCYIQFFDVAQATVNLGTTAPKLSIGIPALGGANLMIGPGIPFATAITVGVTTTRAGSTACSTGLDINLLYK